MSVTHTYYSHLCASLMLSEIRIEAKLGAEDVAQLVVFLPNLKKALGLIFSIAHPGPSTQQRTPIICTQKAKAGGEGLQVIFSCVVSSKPV